jgi:ketol-acid reductoisomerase
MDVFYDRDADLSSLAGKRIGIIGFGSQGHAHALNLRDSGLEVLIGLRGPGESWDNAKRQGFEVSTPGDVAARADLVMVLVPDEAMSVLYREQLEKQLRRGATLGFAHGFNIHFRQIVPRDDLDVIMIAPKAPGRTVRSTFQSGSGVPGLIAVHQDASGSAQRVALAYACAIGSGRAGVIATTFKVETETDLFGEQTVLCGGVVDLIKCGFETLVEAGYPAEMAYFECLHELKLVVDLLYKGGIAGLNDGISNTAEFGEYHVGPTVVTSETKRHMRDVLKNIQSGTFARDFITESKAGQPTLRAGRSATATHPIEQVGARLRAMMPWISAG